MPSMSLLPYREPQKKALMIGMRYKRRKVDGMRALKTTHEDLTMFKGLLVDQYHWNVDDITVMMDAKSHELQPTRLNILLEMQKLVTDVRSGDTLLLYYAGHSDQVPCRHGTEDDGREEAIVSCCGERIIDNDLHLLLVSQLPAGVTLITIFDTCHSGTILDLPHYKNYPVNQYSPPSPKNAVTRASSFQSITSVVSQSMSAAASRLFSAGSGTMLGGLDTALVDEPGEIDQPNSSGHPCSVLASSNLARPGRGAGGGSISTQTEANVISISACMDPQSAWENKKRGLNMTRILIKLLRENPNPTLFKLVEDLQNRVEEDIVKPVRLQYMEKMKKMLRRNSKEKAVAQPSCKPQIASSQLLNADSRLAL